MQQGKDEQRHGKIVAVRLPMSLALDVESAADRELLSVSAYVRRLLHLAVQAEQAGVPMKTFPRGNTLGFTTIFYDENEDVAQPDGATITFTYPKAGHWWPLFGDMESATYDMTPNEDGSWSYGWDSSVSSAGQVSWVSKPATGNFAFTNGVLRLLANDANDFATGGQLRAA